MNLLFITQNVLDASLTKHELAKEMPGLQVEISPGVQDAIRQLAVPGFYNAVLLDSGLHEGDPLAVIKALRAEDGSIAVIGLIEPADLESGINVMGAGADDYVVKRPGFITTLPGVLHRACGQHGASHKTEVKAAPVRRDTAGATRVLLRNFGGKDASLAAVSEIEQNGQDASDIADTDSPGRKLEVRIRELEVQRDALLRSIRAAGENQIHFKDEFSTARSQWDKERRDLDQRLESAEEQRRILDESFHKTARNPQIADGIPAGAPDVKDQLNELESKCRSLEHDLHSAQFSMEEQAKALQYEREQRSLETEGLRNQLNLLEEKRHALEEALSQKEEQQRETDERHAGELQRLRRQQDELEQQLRASVEERSRMREVLQALEAELAKRSEQLRDGSEHWEQQRVAWNRQLDAVEKTYATLEQAVLLQQQQQQELTTRFSADLTKSENARRELEKQLRQAGEERGQLQEALHAVEARIAVQAEQHRSEREQWESMRAMLQHQRDDLEAKLVQSEAAGNELAREAEKSRQEKEDCTTALTDELRRFMDEHNHAVEKHESERVQWESIKNGLEQRKTALEEELRVAEQNRQKLVKEEEARRLRLESTLSELERLRSDAASTYTLAREAMDKYLLQLNNLRVIPEASAGS